METVINFALDFVSYQSTLKMWQFFSPKYQSITKHFRQLIFFNHILWQSIQWARQYTEKNQSLRLLLKPL